MSCPCCVPREAWHRRGCPPPDDEAERVSIEVDS